jgi:hypothetical protein
LRRTRKSGFIDQRSEEDALTQQLKRQPFRLSAISPSSALTSHQEMHKKGEKMTEAVDEVEGKR